MKRILLPVLAVFVVLGGLLLNGRGLESFGDPAVVIAILFVLSVCCIPLFRRTVRTQRWLMQVPWLGLLLTWNGLGAILALYAILAAILYVQRSITFSTPPDWCVAVFFWLWCLPTPFTTLGVIVLLWRSRRTSTSRRLLLYCLVILAVWSDLIAMFVAFVATQGR